MQNRAEIEQELHKIPKGRGGVASLSAKSYNGKMTKEQALKILSRHRGELPRFKVQSISIFGSVARDEATATSDIDLLVEFSQPVGMFEFLDLKEFLERILETRVDLATPQALKKQLRDQILKEAIRAA